MPSFFTRIIPPNKNSGSITIGYAMRIATRINSSASSRIWKNKWSENHWESAWAKEISHAPRKITDMTSKNPESTLLLSPTITTIQKKKHAKKPMSHKIIMP